MMSSVNGSYAQTCIQVIKDSLADGSDVVYLPVVVVEMVDAGSVDGERTKTSTTFDISPIFPELTKLDWLTKSWVEWTNCCLK